MPEFITIKMKREDYNAAILPPHQIKQIKIVDEMFSNDDRYKQLKSISDKAYKSMQEYCFKKRNGMPL